jgi:hypothetical protein
VYEIVIKPWNPYRNKIKSPIITDHILKTKSRKKSIKKNKNDISKPISMVMAKSWGGSIFSEYKKKKVTAMLGFSLK